MPTFTRLAALVCFGLAALYAGFEYYTLYDEPPRSANGIVFLALVSAAVGWGFVGRRLGAGLFKNFTLVIQGFILTLILSFILLGFYNAFTMGYNLRYRSLNEAFEGFFDVTIAHLTRMNAPGFLLLLLGLSVAITLVVSLVFWLSERRRLGQ